MILVDSSAWIEFPRDTGSPVCDAVDRLLDADLAITDPILMEVLAGARDERHLRQLRGLLGRARMLPCRSPDFETAALLYRRCRQRGETFERAETGRPTSRAGGLGSAGHRLPPDLTTEHMFYMLEEDGSLL